MRSLVVTNMYPSAARPALGSFVRDQVRALQRIPEVELELFSFAPGGASAYARAAAELRRRYRGLRFDVVHAHFGLTVWPALAARGTVRAVTLHGTDLVHPRSRLITLSGLRMLDLTGVVSEPLARQVPRWAVRGEISVLPCGVDTDRFRPIPRREARTRLGLDPEGRFLLFPADPARPEKRYDRALAVAGERAAADPGRCRAGAGAPVGERRQRRARPLAAGEFRPRGAGGAGLRRAGAGHPVRDRPPGPGRRPRNAVLAIRCCRRGATRWHRTWRPTSPALLDASGRRSSPPIGWPSGSFPLGGWLLA